MSTDLIQKARNDVFRKIGRNVVNYQRLEGLLKALLISSRIHGTHESLESRVNKKNSSIEKQTMGNLVGAAFNTVFSDKAMPEGPEDTEAAWFSAKFEIEMEQQEKKDLQLALAEIVDERNSLIHHKLTRTDFASIQSCNELGKELDSQREKLIPQYKRIHALLKSKADLHDLLAKYMGSAEFKDFLSGE